jgi:hypothetical protein
MMTRARKTEVKMKMRFPAVALGSAVKRLVQWM